MCWMRVLGWSLESELLGGKLRLSDDIEDDIEE